MNQTHLNTSAPAVTTSEGFSAIGFLEHLVRSGAGAGDTPEILAALCGLRSLVEAVDQREVSIEMLHRTAADIISERHVDEVIASAVDRAHKLLKCDLAYLSLYDAKTRETIVKAASGAISPRFTELRVPFGLGVGGVVARSRQPFETADYLNDSRFGHIERVDSGIADEDIRAMAGAPMIVGNEFVGAIFAANRKVRHFTQEELKQLSTLGAFVGLALSNARMLEGREQALAEAQNAYSVLQRRNEATARMAQLHEKMLEVVTGGGHVATIVDIVAASIGLQVRFFSVGSHAVLSDWIGSLDIEPLQLDEAYDAAMGVSSRNGSCQRLNVSGAGECYLVAVGNGETHYGALVAVGPGTLTGTHQRSLERAALTCALLLGRAKEAQLNAFRGVSRLFQLFMIATEESAGPDLSLFRQFFDDEASLLVMCLKPETGSFDRIFYRVAVVAHAHGGFAAEHAARIYVVVSDQCSPAELRKQFEIEAGPNVNIGLASDNRGLTGIRGVIIDALRAQTFLDERGSVGATARFSELGQLILLMRGKTDAELTAMVDATLAPLLDYDARQGTALVQTLEAYFSVGNNANEAAQRLGIHPKTLAQRLDRVSSLLGSNWKVGAMSLDLRVVLRIHTYLAATQKSDAATDRF